MIKESCNLIGVLILVDNSEVDVIKEEKALSLT